MVFKYAEQKAPADIQKHYTPAPLAKRLVALVPVKSTDTVLDPSAGTNRVFLKHLKAKRKLSCELQAGTDFLSTPMTYDWAITNPPYHLLWRFIEKAAQESRKGFAFLVNINGINTLTPRRLALLEQQGSYMRRLHVCNVKQWMGRYYFYVFQKKNGPVKLSWDVGSWQ
jgi:hypothetical protein